MRVGMLVIGLYLLMTLGRGIMGTYQMLALVDFNGVVNPTRLTP